jgi:hypothetical protein
MASLIVRDSELVLVLTEFERLEGVHGDVHVPLSSVDSVEVVEDALKALESEPGIGVRIGTGVPGVLVIGTIRRAGAKSFVVVHHGHPRGVRVRLHDTEFYELIVGSDDPEALAARLRPSL